MIKYRHHNILILLHSDQNSFHFPLLHKKCQISTLPSENKCNKFRLNRINYGVLHGPIHFQIAR